MGLSSLTIKNIYTHTQFRLEACQVLPKQGNDLVSGSFDVRDFDTIRSYGGDVDHLLELWMIKGSNWLQNY